MLVDTVGSFILFIVVLYLIASPVARRGTRDEETEASALLARKARLLTDIRELDMDLATGKLDEEDHRRLRAATMVDAADTLRELEDMEEAEPSPSASVEPDGVKMFDADDDARLEAWIAARKRELEAPSCSSCGAARDAGDAFCRRCGAGFSAQMVR